MYNGIYQSLVGKLIYLSYIRPDISFSHSVVSQFMHNRFKEYREIIYKISRDVKVNPGNVFIFIFK